MIVSKQKIFHIEEPAKRAGWAIFGSTTSSFAILFFGAYLITDKASFLTHPILIMMALIICGGLVTGFFVFKIL